MGHFYGTVRGNRGEASRMGSKLSGMYAHIRGWTIGVAVELHHDAAKDIDVVQVFKTSGSHNMQGRKLIATFSSKDPW